MKREPNYLVLFFEQPIALSALRLWNYSKTVQRGVNEFEIEIDGMKVYRGFARQAPEDGQGDWSTVVMFDSNQPHADELGRQINFNPGKRQNVLMMNERKIMNQEKGARPRPNEKFVFDEQQRPQTKAVNNYFR